MLRPKVSHIFRTGRPTNFKLGTETEHEDQHQRQAQWPPRSKVKVARSRDASDRRWPISRERNVLEIPKLVERLHTHTGNNAQQFQGQRRSTKTRIADKARPVSAETETVGYHIYWTGRPTNFRIILVRQWSILCQLSRPAIKLWSWVLARGRGHTVSAAPGGHAACFDLQAE